MTRAEDKTQKMALAKVLYEKDKAEAIATFDIKALRQYLYFHSDDEVGRTRDGRVTTLMDEVGEVARLSHKAYTGDGINYYRSRSAMRQVEKSVEEIRKQSLRDDKAAAKKLCYLNMVAKKQAGYSFISRKIDKESEADQRSLVDSFEWCVRHYEDECEEA